MSYQLIQASAHKTGLQDGSIHAVITSPPYFSLRAYHGEQGVDWPEVAYSPMAGLPAIIIPAMHCGLGAEPSPEAFIGHLILVMREMYRILRDDGVAFVNLGDSYNGSGGAGGDYNESGNKEGQPKFSGVKLSELRPKNMLLVPARFALACQADGWIVRSDLPWVKRNSMPESVTDRPGTATEHVFMLAKSERYFFDMTAVKQPVAESTIGRLSQDIENQVGSTRANGGAKTNGNFKAAGDISGRNFRNADLFFKTWQGMVTSEDGDPLALVVNPKGTKLAHFAAWPPIMAETLIKCATSAHGCCSECGAPYVRHTEINRPQARAVSQRTPQGQSAQSSLSKQRRDDPIEVLTTGWQPSCACNCADVIPATILDPFSGSGTTVMAAIALGRNGIGIDISKPYLEELAPERLSNVQINLFGGDA